MNYELLDHLLNPVFLVNKDNKITYYNHICSTYFKLPPRKLNKFEAIDELLVCSSNTIIETIAKAFDSGAPIVTKELTISLPEKSEQNLTVILKMIPVEDFVLIHLWDFSIEKQLQEKYKSQILELKSTHEQIVKSDKLAALGELVAGIGHEVSNPLTIITDRIARIEENLFEGNLSTLKGNLEDVSDGVNRINKIVANMQTFIRNQDRDREVVSLKTAVNESLKFINDLEISKNISLTNLILDDKFVLADNLKIQQVLINLIKNSIDALSDQADGKIEISLNKPNEEETIEIIVRDNGPGVPKEHQEKLFEMFYTSKEIGEGTGLGLSISQKIVEAYQGLLIYDDSENGAVFKIQLPSLELSTFSQTNQYLNGDKEVEDPKIIVMSTQISFLNKVYSLLEEEAFVLIFTQFKEAVEDCYDFYGGNLILTDEKISEELNLPLITLSESELSKDTIIKKVGKYV